MHYGIGAHLDLPPLSLAQDPLTSLVTGAFTTTPILSGEREVVVRCLFYKKASLGDLADIQITTQKSFSFDLQTFVILEANWRTCSNSSATLAGGR